MAKTKKMATDDADDGYSYGPALATSTKKKRLVKLSRKQLKRKQMKRERGENKELMRGNKAQRDFVRRERKDVARTSW